MYKLIALDIDGTLLNSNGIITEKTLSAIEKCKTDNIIVTISTGRPIQGINEFIDKLDLKGPIITYNGGMIVDATTKEVLYQQELSVADSRQVIQLGLEKKTTMTIWSKNQLYVNRMDDHVERYKKLSGNTPILVTDYEPVINQGITKILWIDSVQQVSKYMESVKGKVNDSINYCTSKPYFLEFFDKRVSKAKALEFLGNEYGIKRQEMMAIGDGFNDLSMLEYAGLGVAMGNAPEGVKAVADYVTSSNDEDGIAKVINELVF